ncbi:MAG: S8 family serine peptidase [Anaerolineae bacterium]|nr:S8 family serine peptidase [Anaerolineae bacterium]
MRRPQQTRTTRHTLTRWLAAASMIMLAAVVVLPAQAGVTPSDAPAGQRQSGDTNQVIVKVPADISEADLQALVQSYGGTLADRMPAINAVLIDIPAREGAAAVAAAMAEAVPKNTNVLNVEINGTYSIAEPPLMDSGDFNDPLLWRQDWALNTLDAWTAWDTVTGSSAVVVAVIDTGVRLNHPDLDGVVITDQDYDFVNDDADATDDHGHGTHVAGIIAAEANNAEGVVGVAWGVKILPLKALNSSGSGSWSNIASAIIYAADHGADVINLSLTGDLFSTTVRDAISYATGQGVIVAAASGNLGVEIVHYPSSYDHVISVAGLTEDITGWVWYDYSNYNQYVDIAAPGRAIYSTSIDLDLNPIYGYKSGTSMAAGQVSGVAALMLSSGLADTPAEITEALLCTADDGDDTPSTHVRTDKLGWGAAQAQHAVTYVPGSDACVPTVEHDDFDDALPITFDAGGHYTNTVDVTPATIWIDDPVPCAGNGSRSVWYKVYPNTFGAMTINTLDSEYDTVLAVYTGARGSLSQVVCNNDASGTTSSVSILVEPGKLYYVAVTSLGFDGTSNQGNLHLNVTLSQTPTGCSADPANPGVVFCTAF